MVVTEIPKVTDDMVSGDAVEKEEGETFRALRARVLP